METVVILIRKQLFIESYNLECETVSVISISVNRSVCHRQWKCACIVDDFGSGTFHTIRQFSSAFLWGCDERRTLVEFTVGHVERLPHPHMYTDHTSLPIQFSIKKCRIDWCHRWRSTFETGFAFSPFSFQSFFLSHNAHRAILIEC